VLFSLFWKRTNRAGAIAGMISGGAMVFIWKLGIAKLGGVFAIYELLPAFIFSCICIVVVSLLTKAPSKEIEEDFEAVRNGEALEA
jgi:sodium/proline symporter